MRVRHFVAGAHRGRKRNRRYLCAKRWHSQCSMKPHDEAHRNAGRVRDLGLSPCDGASPGRRLCRAAPRRGCGLRRQLPPAPPTETPSAPQAQEQASSSVPAGQWVYTQQYGWNLDAALGRLHVLPARRLRRALRVCLLSGVRLDVAGRAVGVGLRTVALLRRVRTGAVRLVRSRVLALPGKLALRAVPRRPPWGQACARLCGPRRSWRREASAVPRRCRISRWRAAGFSTAAVPDITAARSRVHTAAVWDITAARSRVRTAAVPDITAARSRVRTAAARRSPAAEAAAPAGPVPAPGAGAADLRLPGAVAPVATWDAAAVGRGRRQLLGQVRSRER